MTNDNLNERKKAISDFVILLHQKGYRKQFALVRQEHSRDMHQASLKSCLEKFFLHFDNSGGKEKVLRLDTYASFVSLQNNIRCSFSVEYDSVRGFEVSAMSVHDARSNDKRQYRFTNNHQVLGSGHVESLFPKPKPWDHFLKGRFRP